MNINAINSKMALLAIGSKSDLYGEKPKPAADVAVKADLNPKDIISVKATAEPIKDEPVATAIDYAKKLASARDHRHRHHIGPLPAELVPTATADVAVQAADVADPPICVMPIRPTPKPVASSDMANAVAVADTVDAPSFHAPHTPIKPIVSRKDWRDHQEWEIKMKYHAQSLAQRDRDELELKMKLAAQSGKHPFATSNG